MSPLIFIIFGVNLEDWISQSTVYTYADDTATGCRGKIEEEVMEGLEGLEEDA